MFFFPLFFCCCDGYGVLSWFVVVVVVLWWKWWRWKVANVTLLPSPSPLSHSHSFSSRKTKSPHPPHISYRKQEIQMAEGPNPLVRIDPAIEKWATHRAFIQPNVYKPNARGVRIAMIAYIVIPGLVLGAYSWEKVGVSE